MQLRNQVESKIFCQSIAGIDIIFFLLKNRISSECVNIKNLIEKNAE